MSPAAVSIHTETGIPTYLREPDAIVPFRACSSAVSASYNKLFYPVPETYHHDIESVSSAAEK